MENPKEGRIATKFFTFVFTLGFVIFAFGFGVLDFCKQHLVLDGCVLLLCVYVSVSYTKLPDRSSCSARGWLSGCHGTATVGEHRVKRSPTTAASRPGSRCGRVPPGAVPPGKKGVLSHLGNGRRPAYPVAGPVPRQASVLTAALFRSLFGVFSVLYFGTVFIYLTYPAWGP